MASTGFAGGREVFAASTVSVSYLSQGWGVTARWRGVHL